MSTRKMLVTGLVQRDRPSDRFGLADLVSLAKHQQKVRLSLGKK